MIMRDDFTQDLCNLPNDRSNPWGELIDMEMELSLAIGCEQWILFLVPWGPTHTDICDFSDQIQVAKSIFEQGSSSSFRSALPSAPHAVHGWF